jgi:hypothetical protein
MLSLIPAPLSPRVILEYIKLFQFSSSIRFISAPLKRPLFLASSFLRCFSRVNQNISKEEEAEKLELRTKAICLERLKRGGNQTPVKLLRCSTRHEACITLRRKIEEIRAAILAAGLVVQLSAAAECAEWRDLAFALKIKQMAAKRHSLTRLQPRQTRLSRKFLIFLMSSFLTKINYDF